MDVHVVDPSDSVAFDRWFAPVAASHTETWPGEPGWQPVELRAQARSTAGSVRTVLLVSSDDRHGGMAAGSVWLELPHRDNRHLAVVSVHVDPAHRRLGAGRSLVAAAGEIAGRDGRRVLSGHHEEPTRLAGRAPARPFAQALGFHQVQLEVRRDLTVPPPSGVLDRLERDAARFAQDYELLHWLGRCPDDLVEARARFGEAMSTDAPSGEQSIQPERWDPARVRETEALVAGADRMLVVSAARHRASGELVAFSEVAVPRAAPEKAYQWDTLVLGPHRGHRLGTLVKVHNLRRLAETSPATRLVVTWNAEQNDPMIRVNEALGCRVVGTGPTWERTI